ncbi:MAG: NFACT family protein [Clostridiales bacterium]|nr:NFACT family protein [Clostridiales bacterium]
MPADSLHIRLAANELNDALAGGRIDKIAMPEPDEIVLHIHRRENHTLILSANPSLPRAHITRNAPKNNPLVAPAFLMHLRKRIGGATIENVSSLRGERILMLHVIARDELGYETKRTLICEILGKYANIILVGSDGKISECLKHVSPTGSEKRPVLPGFPYTPPPVQNKADIFNKQALRALTEAFAGGKLDSYILAGAAGLAPATITGVSYTQIRAHRDRSRASMA